MSRSIRRLTAWLAILALLSMQVAVASYACPNVAAPASTMAADCASGTVDHEQPSLCKAHNDTQSQFYGSHVPATPDAPVSVIALALTPFAMTGDSNASRAEAYEDARHAPDGSPPIFVRNQVFRK